MGNFDKLKVFTGYYELDHLISGLHCGDLITIVGGPGVGKTTFLANIAMNVTMKSKQEAGFVSLQHMPEQLVLRFLAKESNVIMREILRGYIRKEDWHELTSRASRLVECPLTLGDVSFSYMVQLIDGVRKLKQEKPQLKLVIVDSLELLPVHTRKEYAEAFRQLKQAALELRLPILLSCSLPIKKHKKNNKTVVRDPKIDVIKRYSDTVILIDLDISDFDLDIFPNNSIFNRETELEDRFMTRIKSEICLLKNPHGPLGSIFLDFIPQQFKFESIETE